MSFSSINTLLDILVKHSQWTEDATVVTAFLELFESLCIIFGANFTASVVRPRMEAEISRIEQRLARLEEQKTSGAVLVSVYLGAVLGSTEGEEQTVGNVIKRFLVYKSLMMVIQ